MAISVVDGKVPYYGIYNNSAKKALSVDGITSKYFCYVAPWTVNFGNVVNNTIEATEITPDFFN